VKKLSAAGIDQQRIEAVLESGELDPFWYDDTYPDVRLSGLAPVDHYLKIGRRLGRAGTSKATVKAAPRRAQAT
jgi:hypothetical protein